MQNLVLIFSVVFILLNFQAAYAQDVSEMEKLSRLDLLPTFKDSVKIGSFSSYDRTGGNDDGFNGTHSFIRKEAGGLGHRRNERFGRGDADLDSDAF